MSSDEDCSGTRNQVRCCLFGSGSTFHARQDGSFLAAPRLFDAHLLVPQADEAYLLGPAPSSESYLRSDKIVEICKLSGAQVRSQPALDYAQGTDGVPWPVKGCSPWIRFLERKLQVLAASCRRRNCVYRSSRFRYHLDGIQEVGPVAYSRNSVLIRLAKQ